MVVTPGATPVTLPAELIVAIAGALLLQLPLVIALLLKLMEEPTHTALAPLMVPASASGFTEMFADAVAFPQLPVMV